MYDVYVFYVFSSLVGGAQEELTPMEKFKRRKNKNGNPLEFMQLLTSLTKRW